MILTDQSIQILSNINTFDILKLIEAAGRTCYKSEDKISIDDSSAIKFVNMIMKLGHESVIEHVSLTVKAITNRGTSHQLVRHRIASYSQESTRYCNYTKDKFGDSITFIDKKSLVDKPELYKIWVHAMLAAEENYFKMIEAGASVDEARGVLPLDTKTEIVMTYNLRQWRHVLKTRMDGHCHSNIREISEMILKEFKQILPEIFGDINLEE